MLSLSLTWPLSCSSVLDDPQHRRKCLKRVLNLFVFVENAAQMFRMSSVAGYQYGHHC